MEVGRRRGGEPGGTIDQVAQAAACPCRGAPTKVCWGEEVMSGNRRRGTRRNPGGPAGWLTARRGRLAGRCGSLSGGLGRCFGFALAILFFSNMAAAPVYAQSGRL